MKLKILKLGKNRNENCLFVKGIRIKIKTGGYR